MSASLIWKAPLRLALVVLTTACSVATHAQTPVEAPAEAQIRPARPPILEPGAPNDYSDPQTWLCRPGHSDACSVDLTSTAVAADGKVQIEPFKSRGEPQIDCFYVYPTVSRDPTPNSDMNPGPEERSAIQQQLARFGGSCRLFVPIYRQMSLVGLRALLGSTMTMHSFEAGRGYEDVVDAWKYYVQHDNRNRGFVLIGHSQGAAILEQMILREIEGTPLQARMLSAMLIGTTISVPKDGRDVGGSFETIPLCRKASQLGCVISYASFRANVPPTPESLFAKAEDLRMRAACTNPAALAGGKGELRAYLAGKRAELGATVPETAWATPRPTIETPFVTVPGLLSAQCVENEHGSYLEIKINANPADARTDDIPGDIVVNGQVQPGWGLHLIDMNLAMGNLIDIVAAQTKAYLAKKKT